MKVPDGKRRLYESWVQDYADDVYRCAYRLCGQADCAEELAQEVFYAAWRGVDSLRDAAKARLWLLGILRRRYMHWLRDKKRQPKTQPLSLDPPLHLEAPDASPAEAMARQESLQAALDALEDRYKLPFLLVFLEGLTCQEAADFMQVPLGTVLSRIHRARQFLRRQLERQSGTSGHLRLYRDGQQPHRIRDEPPTAVGGA